QRALIDGNRFENCWLDGQNGYAIVLTPRAGTTAPWTTVADITFSNNVVIHAGGGLNMLGTNDGPPTQQQQRTAIRNNLFDDISSLRWNGTGRWVHVQDAVPAAPFDPNPAFQNGFGFLATSATPFTPPPVPAYAQQVRWQIQNNISPLGQFGSIFGDFGGGTDNAAIAGYFPGSIWTKNAIVGGAPANFPVGNFFPATQADVGYPSQATGNYVLLPTSPLHNAATDGKDVGADFAAITAAQTAPRTAPSPPSPPRVTLNPTDRRTLTV